MYLITAINRRGVESRNRAAERIRAAETAANRAADLAELLEHVVSAAYRTAAPDESRCRHGRRCCKACSNG